MNLSFVLHDLVRTLDREADRVLRGVGLSYPKFLAMVIVGEHPGLSGRELAGALGVSDPAVSGTVRSLIGSGLMQDGVRPGAGNVRRLALTATGSSKVAESLELLGSGVDDAARRIGLDPQQLAESLDRLHAAVSTPSAAVAG